MELIPDVEALRDQLLNVLLAARDTVSSILHNGFGTRLPTPHIGFRQQLYYLI